MMRTSEQMLEAICNELVRANATLEHMRSEIRDIRAALGSTSRSSVELAQSPKAGEPPRITVKCYESSEVADAGESAIAEFGRLYRLAEQQMLNNWRETFDALSESRRNNGAS